ncbi:MAG: hypothetical protein U0Q11_13610 [Vicinamibacterales bacterium]
MSASGDRVARLSGLVVFLASLAVCGWWWITRAGDALPFAGAGAVVVDSALFLVFALHHSICARPWAKRIVERIVPPNLVRTLYVWVASALLAAMCVCWIPIGGVVFHAGGAAAIALRLLQTAGLIVGALAVRRTSIGELSGAWDGGPVRLEASGIYGVMRHPLYTSLLLLLVTPDMTGDRALFLGASIVFVVAAIPFEEAGLVRQFGEQYAMYRRAVRWRLIPYIH